jgi:hypothetical protein
LYSVYYPKNVPNKIEVTTNHRIQFMVSIISFMFRRWSAIFESDQYLDWRVGLVFPCFSRLPEDITPVSKHVGVRTYHELYSMICVLLGAHVVNILNIRLCVCACVFTCNH